MMWDALRWRQAGKRKPATGAGILGASVSLLQMRKQEQKRSRPAPG